MTRWFAQDGRKKRGRPAHSQKTLDEAKPRIKEVLKEIGFDAGKDTLKHKLPDIPLRVISTLLKILKLECRTKKNNAIRKNRIHVRVLAKGALMSQDSTHVGSCRHKKVFAEVSKDAATLEAKAFGNGKPVTAKAMLNRLKYLKAKGELPLVLATDNAKAYKDKRVRQRLEKYKVVHLLSRPHTPTDNGRVERCIGEGKALAGLGRGVRMDSAMLGVHTLNQALQALNNYWPRRSRNFLTSSKLKTQLPGWQLKTTRSRFYKAAVQAIKKATADVSGRAICSLTRESIFRTLEQFGLILRTRGDSNIPLSFRT